MLIGPVIFRPVENEAVSSCPLWFDRASRLVCGPVTAAAAAGKRHSTVALVRRVASCWQADELQSGLASSPVIVGLLLEGRQPLSAHMRMHILLTI